MDIFIGYLTGWVRFTALNPSAPKSNSKFEVFIKILSLKQKTKANTSSYNRKTQTFTFQENVLWLL